MLRPNVDEEIMPAHVRLRKWTHFVWRVHLVRDMLLIKSIDDALRILRLEQNIAEGRQA